MRTNWTRERIIRHILEREAEGLPLTIGGDGIDRLLYSACRRIFGSWRNAILASGIPPEHILTWERWSPARILAQIRLLSRRRHPLTTGQTERRYRNLVSAARRHFGSWSKAVLAAGVDPAVLQRVVPWDRERVIETILARALRGEPLVARLVEHRSLVDAGYRHFGSWRAAVMAAGLDPAVTEMPPRRSTRSRRVSTTIETAGHRSTAYRVWSKERIVACILERVREHQPINACAVMRDFPSLYAAANRHLHSWDEAIRAAGLDPNAHRRRRALEPTGHTATAPESQGDGAVRLRESR